MPFVLFHLPDLPRGLSAVRRALATGGSFGATTWSGHDPHPAYDVWVRVISEYDAPLDPSMGRRLDLLPPERRTACLAAAERALAELEPADFVESGTILYSTARAA